MNVEKTAKKISDLKIQGAENIAKEAVKSLKSILEIKNKKNIISKLERARKKLSNTRETEPCMRNALNYVLNNISDIEEEDAAKIVLNRIEETLLFFEESDKKILEYGSAKIHDGTTIYTHCHATTVVKTIIHAKKQGKKIEVHNTETRPKYQGRKTAKELANAGIPITHYVDSAARQALKKSDIMLIGADAITSEGKVVNKIGSELIAEAAQRRGVPVYICTNAWKFDPNTLYGFDEPIEERNTKEIWKGGKGITIENPAFEIIDSTLITGIICELGILRPEAIITEVKKEYPWMFKN